MRYLPTSTLPLIVACALFMENLDGTIISTSRPSSRRISARTRSP